MTGLADLLDSSVVVASTICIAATAVAAMCIRHQSPSRIAIPSPDDPLYDQKLRQVFGGPAPKHFPKAWSEWPGIYGVHGKGKIALVTGGASGVGFYVAKLLAHLGFHVVLPARTGFEAEAQRSKQAILAAVQGAKVTVPSIPLDLESLSSVRRFAASLRDGERGEDRDRLQRLDVLCLNAGRGGSAGDAREETEDGLEAIIQVNVISQFLLAAELLPLLRAAPSARIVSQTSRQRLCKTPGFSRSLRDAKVRGGTAS